MKNITNNQLRFTEEIVDMEFNGKEMDSKTEYMDSDEAGFCIGSTSWGSGEFTLAFFCTVFAKVPHTVVELGTYEGFATYWMGSALKCRGFGKLYSYDLWDEYPYTHCEKSIAERNLVGLKDFVELRKKDAWKAHEDFEDNSVDVLYVDISNDGNTYKEFLFNWYPKLKQDAIVLFEGGTIARDNVEWMIKYNKKSIVETLRTDSWILSHFNFGTMGSFPGLTIFTKKEF